MFVLTMLKIQGPCRLEGVTAVQGAKNSALPLLAASVLCRGESVFRNCPDLTDVKTSADILRHLGCRVRREGDALIVDSTDVTEWDIPDKMMRRMRSSIVFLGAILSRAGKAELSYPGGCELGPRPIDLHLRSLEKLGARIREQHGRLFCERQGDLLGGEITLSFPSVGATENILLTAVTAKGTTVVHNAAKEPEIGDLIAYLNRCGGDVREDGAGTLVIRGVSRLTGCEHTILPDRIAAATLLSAAAATGGSVTLEKTRPAHLRPVLQVLEQSGCAVKTQKDRIALTAPEQLCAVESIRTMPYPGFPTDSQSPVMAMLLKAKGVSVFVENIFESRFKHVDELIRMGADIRVAGRVAVVQGVSRLYGARVVAPDLRGGAALVIAGLAAQGITEVQGVDRLDRGYDRLEETLQKLGAEIQRVKDTLNKKK